jgi:hypothetical protein
MRGGSLVMSVLLFECNMALRLQQKLVYVALDDLESTLNQKFTEAHYIHVEATPSTGSESSESKKKKKKRAHSKGAKIAGARSEWQWIFVSPQFTPSFMF